MRFVERLAGGLLVLGTYTVLKATYKIGEAVGELKTARRQVKQIHKEFKEGMKRAYS